MHRVYKGLERESRHRMLIFFAMLSRAAGQRHVQTFFAKVPILPIEVPYPEKTLGRVLVGSCWSALPEPEFNALEQKL